MAREPTILHVQPDDVLLIGNVDIHLPSTDQMLTELKAALPSVRKVFVFGSDIDVKILREFVSETLHEVNAEGDG